MGSLLIVTGPPGAGKSSVADCLVRQLTPSILVAGDAFFSFLAEGAIQPWLPESDAQNGVVTEAAAAATGRFATDYETVYDGVLGPWFLETFVRSTGLATIDYVILLPRITTCLERVRSRSGHGFTDLEATLKMHHEFSDAEVDERYVLREPAGTPDEIAEAVISARQRGTLGYRLNPSHPG